MAAQHALVDHQRRDVGVLSRDKLQVLVNVDPGQATRSLGPKVGNKKAAISPRKWQPLRQHGIVF